jgi:hypothetical protein
MLAFKKIQKITFQSNSFLTKFFNKFLLNGKKEKLENLFQCIFLYCKWSNVNLPLMIRYLIKYYTPHFHTIRYTRGANKYYSRRIFAPLSEYSQSIKFIKINIMKLPLDSFRQTFMNNFFIFFDQKVKPPHLLSYNNLFNDRRFFKLRQKLQKKKFNKKKFKKK